MIQKKLWGGGKTPVKTNSYPISKSNNFKKISIICLFLSFFSFNVKAEETNGYTASQVSNLCIRLKSTFASDIGFANNKEYKSCVEFSCDCYDSNPESIKQVSFAMYTCFNKFESYKASLKQKEEEENETLSKKNEPVENGPKWYDKKIEDYTDSDAADYINSRHLYDGEFSCSKTIDLRWACDNGKYTCNLFGLRSQPNNPPKYKCDPIISRQSNDIFDSLENDSFDDNYFEKYNDEMENFALSHSNEESKEIYAKEKAINKFLNIKNTESVSYQGDKDGNFTVIHNGKTTKVHVDENNNVTLLEQ